MTQRNSISNIFGDAVQQDENSVLPDRIAALNKVLSALLERHKHLSGYFEAMLHEMESEAKAVLFLKLARWLKNQPKDFQVELDALYAGGTLADEFGAALADWVQSMLLDMTIQKSKIRRAYATQLFPSLGSVAVGINVIHQESHHANHVDMVYVCGMAGAVGAKQIFEFGTYRGQTTCGLASVCSDAQIYTLNLPPEADPRYAPFIGIYIGKSPDRDRITQIFCDSRTFDPTPYRGLMDYIFIDGDHSYEGVKNDTEKAIELLKPGGVIVWHDYAAKSPGVLEYLAEFSRQRPLFHVRNTCLAVYVDGVDAMTVALPPMDASLEAQEYSDELSDIERYFRSGRIPWSPGYKQYRYGELSAIPTNVALLEVFGRNEPLPSNYGIGLDERIVEYPWLLSRMRDSEALVLDGGSVLNYPFLLDAPQLADKRVVIMTLAPESTMAKRKNVSYVFGDLRNTIFRDDVFDLVVSVSTLEHIGMDNAKLYTDDGRLNESRPDDYLKVIEEFRRVLKPGGRFLMTVPFGKAQNVGWLYQFDAQRLRQAVAAFGPGLVATTFYKYGSDGWGISGESSCGDCEYFDVHSAAKAADDLAAAARAVVCLEFVKHA